MSTRHTPGPWAFGLYGPSDEWVRVAETGDAVVMVGHNQPERAANARLIAAAPELLGACKAALAAFNATGKPHSPAADACRDAIAKAEGRDTRDHIIERASTFRASQGGENEDSE